MICAVFMAIMLPIYLFASLVVVAFEGSNRYIEAVVGIVVAVPVLVYLSVLPGRGRVRLAEQWAAGHPVDRASAMEATYTWARRLVIRTLSVNSGWAALAMVAVAAIAGATGSRLIQYAVLGAVVGPAIVVIGVHSGFEAALRPARSAIAGGTGIGDSLPQSRPTYAAWTNMAMLGAVFAFSVAGAQLAAVFDPAGHGPVVVLMIACALTLFSVAITLFLHSRRLCGPFATSPRGPNVLPPATTANGCRWFRMTTSAHWRRRSTACRRVWLSGNDFRLPSVRTSIRFWRPVCSSRVTMCSPVSAAR
jgi:adenylate cyclase